MGLFYRIGIGITILFILFILIKNLNMKIDIDLVLMDYMIIIMQLKIQKKGKKNARSLYVVKDIMAGEVFTNENIKSIRPGHGLQPWHYEEILGKVATVNIKRGTAMRWEFIENNRGIK